MSMHKLIWFSTMFVHSYMEKTIYNTGSLHHWSFAFDSAVIRFFWVLYIITNLMSVAQLHFIFLMHCFSNICLYS